MTRIINKKQDVSVIEIKKGTDGYTTEKSTPIASNHTGRKTKNTENYDYKGK